MRNLFRERSRYAAQPGNIAEGVRGFVTSEERRLPRSSACAQSRASRTTVTRRAIRASRSRGPRTCPSGFRSSAGRRTACPHGDFAHRAARGTAPSQFGHSRASSTRVPHAASHRCARRRAPLGRRTVWGRRPRMARVDEGSLAPSRTRDSGQKVRDSRGHRRANARSR